jgi:PAS domain S-box-containing protein
MSAERVWFAASQTSDDHMAVVDDEGVIVAVNEAWRAFGDKHGLGLVEAGMGANYLDVCERSNERGGLEAAAGVRRVLAGETDAFELEYPCFTPDEALWFSMRVTRFMFGQPERPHARVCHRNVTRRHIIEERLQSWEDRWRTLVKHAPVYIGTLHADGRIRELNRSATGFSVDVMVGLNAADGVAPEHREAFERALVDARRLGSSQCAVQGTDGRWFEVRLARLEHPDNDAMFVLVASDVTDAKRFQQHRERYVSQVLESAERERSRIARDLHDQTGPSLAAIAVALSRLEDEVETSRARELVEETKLAAKMAIEEVSRLARGLHPAVLEELGLSDALHHYARDYAKTHGIRIETQVESGSWAEQIAPHLQATIYRVAQEALTNAARHASPSSVSVVLTRHEELIRLLIEDDGSGFDVPAIFSEPPRGLGLHGMRERAALVGARLLIDSEVGRGTSIVLDLPLPSDDA